MDSVQVKRLGREKAEACLKTFEKDNAKLELGSINPKVVCRQKRIYTQDRCPPQVIHVAIAIRTFLSLCYVMLDRSCTCPRPYHSNAERYPTETHGDR